MAKPAFSRRRKTCPFSGKGALTIDYKDVNMLKEFISETGKIIPSRIMFVSAKKQRELSLAIKRARMIGLLPFAVVKTERNKPRPRSFDKQNRTGGRS